MRLGTICNREVVIAGPNDSIVDAAQKMRALHVGTLVVVEQRNGRNVPLGILTDRDIVVGVVAEAYNDVTALKVNDVMSDELVTADEDEDSEQALLRMRRLGVRRMPVVDEGGALVGILSMDDVIELIMEQLEDVVKLVAREQQVEKQRRPVRAVSREVPR